MPLAAILREALVTARTFRRWVELGLVPAPERVAGPFRTHNVFFTPWHVEVVRSLLELRRGGRRLDDLRPRRGGEPCDWWPPRHSHCPGLRAAALALEDARLTLALPREALPLLALAAVRGALPRLSDDDAARLASLHPGRWSGSAKDTLTLLRWLVGGETAPDPLVVDLVRALFARAG